MAPHHLKRDSPNWSWSWLPWRWVSPCHSLCLKALPCIQTFFQDQQVATISFDRQQRQPIITLQRPSYKSLLFLSYCHHSFSTCQWLWSPRYIKQTEEVALPVVFFYSDLLSLTWSRLIEIHRIVTFKWVKGHQDSLMSYENLPRVARLNIDADFLATRYRLRGKLKTSRYIDH